MPPTPPQPPQPPEPRRVTWVDKANRYWRLEPVADRWQLSRYSPNTETWTPVGSWPSRGEAIQAAADQDESW